MKRFIWIAVLVFMISVFYGCSNNQPAEIDDSALGVEESTTATETIEDSGENEENEQKDNGEVLIESFIEKYNASTDTPITEMVSFNPQDRDSGHYRTEFRLGAWDGSVGTTALIGESSIDIVSYGSHGGFYENTDLRIYVSSQSADDLFTIFKIAAKVMDDTVTDEEIQEVIDHVNEYGDSNGFIIGDMEPGNIHKSDGLYELILTVED